MIGGTGVHRNLLHQAWILHALPASRFRMHTPHRNKAAVQRTLSLRLQSEDHYRSISSHTARNRPLRISHRNKISSRALQVEAR